MTETIDHETGEIMPSAAPLPAVRYASPPSPYQSSETGQLAQAMATVQGEMKSPLRTKEGKIEGVARGSGKEYSFKYKYAPFEEIVRVIKEAFPRHGLMYQQGLVVRGDQYFIRTYIRHSSGEWTASDYPVIADKSGPQGFAGASTYAKRYGLSLAVGLAAEDDDDGAAAQAAVPDARANARGAAKAPAEPADAPLVAGGYAAARGGEASLRGFWEVLGKDQRLAMKELLESELKPLAAARDRELAESEWDNDQNPSDGAPNPPDGAPSGSTGPQPQPEGATFRKLQDFLGA